MTGLIKITVLNSWHSLVLQFCIVYSKPRTIFNYTFRSLLIYSVSCYVYM
jgi:hypothetical protein